MNNEIQEILDKLKDNKWYNILDLTDDKWIDLKQIETNQILDYITNLEQENERLNNMLNNADNKNLSLIEEINEKQDIIEKAVKLIHNKLDRFDCDGSMAVSMSISYFEEDLLNILQNGGDKDE